MTVLTSLPSKDAKNSDQVPLVDGHVNSSSQSPPPPYEPKVLEAGGCKNKGGHVAKAKIVNGADTNLKPPMDLRRFMSRVVSLCLLFVVFLMVFVLTIGPACRAFNRYIESDPDHWGNKYKSYTSYADAEKDMIKPADCDYDVYKSLANSAFEEGAVLVSGPDLAATAAIPEAPAATKAIAAASSEASGATTNDDDGKPHVTKTARFIHDFSVNITGIVDVAAHTCYVMPLFHDAKSPVSLNEVMFKMTRGSYEMNMKKVISTMHVIKPEFSNLAMFGLYISKDCADYPTYWLERTIHV